MKILPLMLCDIIYTLKNETGMDIQDGANH